MKLLNKIKILQGGYKITKIFIAGILVWSEEKSFLWRRIKIFGITLLSYRNKASRYKKEQIFEDLDNFIKFANKQYSSSNKKSVLWLDHSSEGGAETYSFNQFSELESDYIFIRLQYDPLFDVYILSIPDKAVGYTSNFNTIKTFISKFNFFEICVNNLVGWIETLELLKLISHYKENHSQTKISFKGHDFHAICPSLNLLNCDKVFCNLTHQKGCSYCIKNVTLDNNEQTNKILFNGFNDIDTWRKSWNDFFQNTLDEIIVFSNSTKDLFIRAYPVLKTKVRIIPHTTIQLPVVEIKKHKDINIAILGNISSIAKGYDVIEKMCKLNRDPHLNLIVIGTYKSPPRGLIVTGKYKPIDIPKLIKQYNIDIVFIPSISPETFSYTTSEAMNMNLPVACYNMGAPAERVSKYKQGLVLKDINPLENLQEIKNFVKQLRKEIK